MGERSGAAGYVAANGLVLMHPPGRMISIEAVDEDPACERFLRWVGRCGPRRAVWLSATVISGQCRQNAALISATCSWSVPQHPPMRRRFGKTSARRW